MDKVTIKPVENKIYFEGKVYDARTILDSIYLGGRLTDCCECFSTIDDVVLYCKKCYQTVEWGEGDGSENLAKDYMVNWKISKKTNNVISCIITRETESEFQTRLESKGIKVVQLGGK